MNNFTKGPWMVSSFDECEVIAVKHAIGIICNTSHDDEERSKEDAANARLISLAPDYHAAAEMLINAFGDAPDDVIRGAFGEEVFAGLCALQSAHGRSTGEFS